jgi:acyl carrier protein phosphodiesterase
VDIYYDHFLALDWKQFHTQSLRSYVDSRYELLQNNAKRLPLKTQRMLPYMIQNDWLYNYQYLEGIQKVMNGMSGRSKFDSKMEKSVKELKLYHEDFRKEFHSFFPELKTFSEEMVKTLI